MPTRPLTDLAWLLTAPPLIDDSALPGIDLGSVAQGRDWLARSAPLLSTAQAQADLAALRQRLPSPFRLGRYAEALMAHALRALPDATLLGRNLVVQAADRTLGEFDFLLREADGRLLHLELAVKLYLALPQADGPPLLVGPGLRDALPLKLRALQRQCRLAQTPQGQAILAGLASPLASSSVQVLAWLRGWVFFPMDVFPMSTDSLAHPHHPLRAEELAAQAPQGWWQVWNGRLPAPHTPILGATHRQQRRWRWLARPDWLAPGQADASAVAPAELEAQLQQHFQASTTPCLLAEYPAASEGSAEMSRGFVLPPGWPQADALAALRQRLGPDYQPPVG